MFQIVEKEIRIEFPRGHHLHALVCQIPNHLAKTESSCRLTDPQEKWEMIRSILELVAEGPGNLKRCHFLVFPESALPSAHIGDALALIDRSFRPNSITIFGVEHIHLHEYRDLLAGFAQDNAEALQSVLDDLDSGRIDRVPVNICITAVKESDGRMRVFLQAKSHPFVGEENIDPFQDLYRGKVFPLLRCNPSCFNFMTLICLDYIYRDLYQSNISVVIDRANELFFQTRQRLDLLMVLECNPKPEHQAFRDVVNGFYGEYLAYTPGVRETITLFCNTSDDTSGIGDSENTHYGHSAVIIHKSHKTRAGEHSDFLSDDFGGLPVCRLRFGNQTRLYYFNLPLFHELDPRTTRVPLKIHGIYQAEGPGWAVIE